ncbi:MAG: hypothetical protein PHV16_04465 [Candidatus Nanoarchaeia archaeon]|nr:hypothetical protein [Candidatus Nanoarchaeia archaeon]
MHKNFVMVDGLDGSGKGVIVNALRKWAEEKNLNILDLKDFCDENKRLPKPNEITDYDAIISCEMTNCWIGSALREEIVRNNKRDYSILSTAQAFALDREILYKRVLIPALKQGKYVFQKRGVISSIVYQPLQGSIALSEIMKMPGNRLAIQNAPGLLLIAVVAPETVMYRLKQREKQDSAIFEEINFQRKLEQRYNSQWLKNLFENHGSKVIYIDTNFPKTTEDTEKETLKIWADFTEDKFKEL